MLDWHRSAWREQFAARPIPQSLLLVAARGSGEVGFARALAGSLLCATPDSEGLPCGRCDDCRWFRADAHPDFLLLDPTVEGEDGEGAGEGADAPAEKGKRKRREIDVRQVRAAGAFIRISPVRERARVVMLRPAESLNAVAANALLKNLEEPPAGARFILVSNAPGRLLPTVRSRCVRISLPRPAPEAAAAWLEAHGQANPALALAQAGGMPEAAAALDERYWQVRGALLDRLGDADAGIGGLELVDTDWPTVVHVAQTWAWDLMAARFGVGVRYHPDKEAGIRAMARRVDPLAVAAFEQRVARSRRLLEHPLNVRLQTEQILIDSQAL